MLYDVTPPLLQGRWFASISLYGQSGQMLYDVTPPPLPPTLQGRWFASIGLYGQSGQMLYDVTNPSRSFFLDYITNRNFSTSLSSSSLLGGKCVGFGGPGWPGSTYACWGASAWCSGGRGGRVVPMPAGLRVEGCAPVYVGR